ncbi:uncharacterized protein CXQ87_005318 [Candidozyma duobushaemuli]|uniref:BRCT domain-containing protein n=2 Tax=Candidozyma TaxID=3303203 RepID=A0ABX8IED3_9ASCO|nr:uncharacterized protein CXQ87_005318 [[Candida] duobushaemulonis]PVH15039.1 hypothetical protein CXQ87_005318 [[Candida] duobushaemulonis]QWU89893.1 hypothetical protein CA3LBN_004251 [[Candida] haemuloni]
MDKPFQGRTFCCTGLHGHERHDMADKILALGGTHYTDLMSSVKYLIVGNRNTEKYKYSIKYRHDVVFLPQEAITRIHQRWTAGDDTGLEPESYSMAVFDRFTVCVARIDRPPPGVVSRLFGEKFRTPPDGAVSEPLADAFSTDEVSNSMEKKGAQVSTTLTPSCDVVVSTEASGKRYTMAKQWGIPVVHPLWVYDSVLRGAALDLDDYVLTSDGSNLYNSGSFVWKKLYSGRAEPVEKAEPERAPLKKSSDVWSSIMSSRAKSARVIKGSLWEEPSEEETAKSVAPASPERKSSLFSGFKFLPVGFSIPQQKVLREVVESHGGEVAESANDDTISHIVLLVKSGPQASLMLSVLSSNMKRRINSKEVHVVTDWFIERSIFYKEVRHDSWCKPLQGLVPSAKKFKVCITGFTGVELLHIEKLVEYLNLEFCQTLASKRDLLIVNINLFKDGLQEKSPSLFKYKYKDVLDCPIYTSGDRSSSVSVMSSQNKMNAAKKWNIPIVSVAYLWEMIQRSAGKANLQMPDIFDLTWCIYAPRSMAKPTTLLDYVRTMNDDFETQKPEESDSIKLPSPRKAREKQKYGRLAGSRESLTEKLKKAQDSQENSEVPSDDRPPESDDIMTQVGYVNQDSVHNNEELMKKLGEDIDRPAKRTRRARN